MDLFERVSEDIKNAMKAKDKVALETLRNVKKVFLEAKTAPGANDTLTDADALKIIQKLTKQGKDAAEIYVQQGRQDLADAELAQVKVMEAYLPKQMSPEELEAALKAIIAEVGATGGKDMGKVMGVASKKLAGLAEGRAIFSQSKRIAGIRIFPILRIEPYLKRLLFGEDSLGYGFLLHYSSPVLVTNSHIPRHKVFKRIKTKCFSL